MEKSEINNDFTLSIFEPILKDIVQTSEDRCAETYLTNNADELPDKATKECVLIQFKQPRSLSLHQMIEGGNFVRQLRTSQFPHITQLQVKP